MVPRCRVRLQKVGPLLSLLLGNQDAHASRENPVDDRLGYVDAAYLDAVKARLHHTKQRSYDFLKITPGATLLDVGCGPGTDTLALARLVGEDGRVTGVDSDPDMVAAANERARADGLADRVTHRVADATALPFPDNSFDACWSERLFQHLPDSSAALAEMVRVAKPGGRIVVVDTDWGTASVDTAEPDIERRLNQFRIDRLVRNGYSGRQLNRLFRQANLLDVIVEPRVVDVPNLALLRLIGNLDELEAEARAANVVTTEELERWRAGLEQAEQTGTLFACATMVLTAGRKPDLPAPEGIDAGQ